MAHAACRSPGTEHEACWREYLPFAVAVGAADVIVQQNRLAAVLLVCVRVAVCSVSVLQVITMYILKFAWTHVPKLVAHILSSVKRLSPLSVAAVCHDSVLRHAHVFSSQSHEQ